MNTAKVFKSGNSQAIRLPKEFRLDTDKVKITRLGNNLLIEPIKPDFDDLESILDRFSADLEIERYQPSEQKRKPL